MRTAKISLAKFLQELLRNRRVARRTPVAIGEKMSGIDHRVVQIDTNMRELTKYGRG